MPIARFQMPDGRVARFEVPEGTTPEQAQASFEEFAQSPQAAPPERQGADLSLHRAGVLARGLATGPTSTAGFMGDMLNKGINRAGVLIGHNPELGMPSEGIQGWMDKAGLPRAENTTEKVVETLAGMATGSRDPIARAAVERAGIVGGPLPPKPLNARERAIKEGMDLGYKVPSSLSQGGIRGTVLESMANKPTLYNKMEMANQPITNSVSAKVVGLPPGMELSEDAINAAKKATEAATYEPLKGLGTITAGRTYKDALRKVLSDFQGISRSSPLATPANDNGVAELVAKSKINEMNAKDAVEAIEALRSNATQAFRTGNSELGLAQRAVAKALEQNLELNLSTAGSPAHSTAIAQGLDPSRLLAQFRAGRVQLAKQEVVSKAFESGTGNVNLNTLGNMVKKNGENYLTDELATMGNFARNAKKVSSIPPAQSIPMYRHPIGQAVGAGAAAFLPGGQLPALAIAGYPAVQAGIRSGIMSNMGQRMIAPKQLDPSILARLGNSPAAVSALPAGLYGPPSKKKQTK